jgi:uncharacterized membrane protein YjgN (DUF898 family)
MDAQPTQPAASLLENPSVAYVGRLGALYWLMIVNLLLTIVTFGVYRFWARTRIRRFLWANTLLAGEPFEYTGTGAELLKGFLRALVLFVPLVLVIALGQLFLPPAIEGVVTAAVYLLFGFLALVGSFAAQRYQLRRSTWRGIRFGMDGSPFAYGREMGWRWLLAPLTMFLMLPWIAAARLARTVGRTRFGTARFAFSGDGGVLFPWMILAIGAFWLALVPGLMLAGGLIWTTLSVVLGGGDPGQPPSPPALLAGLFAIFAVLVFAFGIGGAIYQAATLRFTFDHTQLAAVRFSFAPSIGRTARFLLGNTLLVLLSLGLLGPLALHRRMRFLAAAVAVRGSLDLAQVGQTGAGEQYGEGLADALGLESGPL